LKSQTVLLWPPSRNVTYPEVIVAGCPDFVAVPF
jgi:hypothetical protein